MKNFIEVQNAEMVFSTRKGRFHALREINLNDRIGSRVRTLRAASGLSLAAMAAAELSYGTAGCGSLRLA